MFVLCVAGKRQKGKMQDKQDKETITDKVQTTKEYKKIAPGAGCLCWCTVKAKTLGRTIKIKKKHGNKERAREGIQKK